MKNSLNILTQQKQQEINERIKDKQNKEILQSLKRDIIIILDDKIKKYYIKYGAFYILDNQDFIINEVLDCINKLGDVVVDEDFNKEFINYNYKLLPELIKIDLISDLFYKEFKKVKKQVDEFNKYKIEVEEKKQIPEIKKSGIPKIWLCYLGLKFLNKKLKK